MEPMAMDYSFWWIALSSIMLGTGALLAWIKWLRGKLSSDNLSPLPLPSGSRGWPLIGETVTFFRTLNSPNHHPRQFATEREKRYGPVFRSNLFGNARTVVSVDAEFNKFVLQNEGRLFQASYPSSNNSLAGKYGMVTVHGDLQRKLHAIAVNLLSCEKLRSDFIEEIQSALSTAMKKWQSKKCIHLLPECHQMVLNLMGKKLLCLPPAVEETKGIYKAFNDLGEALACLPINIPGFAYNRGLKAREVIVRTVHECIKERREHPKVERNDLLTKLVKEGSLSDEIITDFLLFFMFAGYVTASTSMALAVKFLSQTPSALEELRAEHDALLKVKGNEKLTWEDYQSMKFTHCVIKETLRLGNLSVGIPREAKQDIKVKDFVIPKGWSVFVFQNATHLDGKYYPEPLTFNPWRWQDEGQELSEKPWYIPFGGGARLCPGLHLARFEIALFLHYFVTKFRWEQLEDDHIKYFPVPSLSKGLPIQLHLRGLIP